MLGVVPPLPGLFFFNACSRIKEPKRKPNGKDTPLGAQDRGAVSHNLLCELRKQANPAKNSGPNLEECVAGTLHLMEADRKVWEYYFPFGEPQPVHFH